MAIARPRDKGANARNPDEVHTVHTVLNQKSRPKGEAKSQVQNTL